MIAAIKDIVDDYPVAHFRQTTWFDLLNNGFYKKEFSEYYKNICTIIGMLSAEVPEGNLLLDNLRVFMDANPVGNIMELKYNICIDGDVGTILILLNISIADDQPQSESVKRVFRNFLSAYHLMIPRNISIADDL